MNRRGMEVVSPSSYVHNSNWLFQESRGATWTPEENKRFENALALYDNDTPDRWARVAAMIPGKTVGDVIKHYKELLEDVSDIEAGLIPIPRYGSESFTLECVDGCGYDVSFGQLYGAVCKKGTGTRPSDQERKKGVPWTQEEHRQFLMGLQKYGKGDWRNISRNFVTTRTPTQVASHAQKYFIRQTGGGKDKRRSSIHDITTLGLPNTKSPLPDQNANKQSSPDHPTVTATTSTMQQKMVGLSKSMLDWKLQNESVAPVINAGNNAFLSKAPLSFSPGHKLKEQNLLGGSLPGYQFESHHNMFFPMQSMQQPRSDR